MAEEKKTIALGKPYRILVVNGGYDYIKYLFDLDFHGAKNLDEADIVLFTGGEDVASEWYGEKQMKCTFSNIDRDRREKVIFEQALEKGIPMVGICRGGQFLNCMPENGGKMWQDVTGHTGNHQVMEVVNLAGKRVGRNRRKFTVTSTHHQMMRPSNAGLVLAVGIDADENPLCDSRVAYGQEFEGKDGVNHPDVEVVWYERTKCLCFQPHPEFRTAPYDCKNYFEECLDAFVLPSAP